MVDHLIQSMREIRMFLSSVDQEVEKRDFM